MTSPKLSALGLALAMALVAAPGAHAVTRSWIGPNGSLWSSSASWLGTVVPVNGDDAVLGTQPAGTSNVTASFASIYGGAGLNSLRINSTGISGVFTLDQSAAASAMIASTEVIGDTIGGNSDQQSNGSNSAGTITLGNQSSGFGTYALSGSGTVNVGTLQVGGGGGGTFNHGGGTGNVSSFLGVSLSSATFVSPYNLSGGTLAVASGACIGVGASRGNFGQTGGTVSFGGSAGIYIGNGTISGTFTHSGGSFANAAGSLDLGEAAGATGTYNLGGTGSIALASEVIGASGSGTFNQTGGSNSLPANGNLYVGYNPATTGTYLLKGGTLTSGVSLTGAFGTGTTTQSGGAHTTGLLQLGYDSGAAAPTT
jgi:hypothetical protein